MADIELVIKIPEEEYKKFLKMRPSYPKGVFCYIKAIQNGTPLPKGHGRLIDADAFLDDLYQLCDDCETLAENPYVENPHVDSIVDVLENSSTVIPADNEAGDNRKTGWYIAHGMIEDRFWCSCGFVKIMDRSMTDWKYCPKCGATKADEEEAEG